MHLLDGCLQADISNNTSLGSVATLTSDSPFAHADEPTNHKNEKTTVTTKSYRNKQKDKTVKEKWILETNQLFGLSFEKFQDPIAMKPRKRR